MNRLLFFSTLPHDCNYLSQQLAISVVADPRAPMSTAVYARLIDLGFRRSGAHVYAPNCPSCRACVPTRIPVADFAPNRSQRRCLKRNQDLDVFRMPAKLTDEYFELYRRYLSQRHVGGGMDDPTPESFEHFLIADWCDTLFVEFRKDGQLLALAATDILPQGLSATYTFFDPQISAQRTLGGFAIQWQINEARLRNIDYLYLGYWINNCDKMRYKTQYRPIEGYVEGQWRLLGNPD